MALPVAACRANGGDRTLVRLDCIFSFYRNACYSVSFWSGDQQRRKNKSIVRCRLCVTGCSPFDFAKRSGIVLHLSFALVRVSTHQNKTKSRLLKTLAFVVHLPSEARVYSRLSKQDFRVYTFSPMLAGRPAHKTILIFAAIKAE